MHDDTTIGVHFDILSHVLLWDHLCLLADPPIQESITAMHVGSVAHRKLIGVYVGVRVVLPTPL